MYSRKVAETQRSGGNRDKTTAAFCEITTSIRNCKSDDESPALQNRCFGPQNRNMCRTKWNGLLESAGSLKTTPASALAKPSGTCALSTALSPTEKNAFSFLSGFEVFPARGASGKTEAIGMHATQSGSIGAISYRFCNSFPFRDLRTFLGNRKFLGWVLGFSGDYYVKVGDDETP